MFCFTLVPEGFAVGDDGIGLREQGVMRAAGKALRGSPTLGEQ